MSGINEALKICTACFNCCRKNLNTDLDTPAPAIASDDDVIDINTTLLCCVYTNSLRIDTVDTFPDGTAEEEEEETEESKGKTDNIEKKGGEAKQQ